MTTRDDVGGEIKSRPKKREDTEMDITPMIDMTFLLLAFFIMCSKMDPTVAVDLPGAFYGDPVSEKDSVVLVVAAGATKADYTIYKGRSDEYPISETEPMAQEEAVAMYVQQELSARPDVQAVVIKAEGKVKSGAVETVKRGVIQAELAEGRRLYVAVEEKQ
ncbi:MAG: biopolymer transporter ExbD [Pirellulaceae bacterium]|jgi:biopolymer transport protein ExbD|nr:biopolymer transporter ExbD [Pirellulaceae bacterium]